LGAGGREFESRRPDHAIKVANHSTPDGEHMPARIYKPSRNAMQSGKGKSEAWFLEYEQENARVADPLMGWTSTQDTMNQVKLSFATLEEAEAYAKRKGVAYVVQAETPVRMQKKSYSDNFKFGRTDNWTH
jgi:ETC complex I subunit conserved region